MTRQDLVDWQRRLGLSQPQAAAALGMALATYRGIVQGRRHTDEVPGPVVALTRYIERYGILDDA